MSSKDPQDHKHAVHFWPPGEVYNQDSQIDRQTERQTNKQRDRQIDRKTYKQTDRQTNI